MSPGDRILPKQEFSVGFDDTNFMGTIAYNFTEQLMTRNASMIPDRVSSGASRHVKPP